MQEQIDNGNYVEINVEESRKNNQLHFVGYNFLVIYQVLHQSEDDN